MAHEAILRLLVGHYVLNGTAQLTVLEKNPHNPQRISNPWCLGFAKLALHNISIDHEGFDYRFDYQRSVP